MQTIRQSLQGWTDYRQIYMCIDVCVLKKKSQMEKKKKAYLGKSRCMVALNQLCFIVEVLPKT